MVNDQEKCSQPSQQHRKVKSRTSGHHLQIVFSCLFLRFPICEKTASSKKDCACMWIINIFTNFFEERSTSRDLQSKMPRSFATLPGLSLYRCTIPMLNLDVPFDFPVGFFVFLPYLEICWIYPSRLSKLLIGSTEVPTMQMPQTNLVKVCGWDGTIHDTNYVAVKPYPIQFQSLLIRTNGPTSMRNMINMFSSLQPQHCNMGASWRGWFNDQYSLGYPSITSK